MERFIDIKLNEKESDFYWFNNLPSGIIVYYNNFYSTMKKEGKSIRSIRKIRKSEPKLIEGPKKTLLIRGNKTSNSVKSFLTNIVNLLLLREA